MTTLARRRFLELTGPAVAAIAAPRAIVAQRRLPKSEFDYVDWSWQRWRTLTRSTPPRVTAAQTGKAELVDLLSRSGVTIASSEEWQSQRGEIRRVLDLFLGRPPRTIPPPNARIIEVTQRGSYTLQKLAYQAEPGEFVPAYLLIPANLRGRAAAIICPHQTTQAGKKEPAGLEGNPQLHTAVHLVERGYVTLTFDALCFGERHDPTSGHYGDAIPFYRKHPRWSLLGKMAWDVSRAIDYLQTLDFVNTSRIGSIGHSHGGYTTLWAMALDQRIKAGVSNCGFDTFRIDGNTWRWSRATALLPLLGYYITNSRLNMDFYRGVPDSGVINVPFDLHQLLALIAPRPVLLSTSDDDFVFPNGGWSLRRSLQRLQPVYQLLGSPNNLSSYVFNGGHNFPSEASANAYRWFDAHL